MRAATRFYGLPYQDWARLLAEAASRGEAARREINEHFLPQTDSCALDALGCHLVHMTRQPDVCSLAFAT